MAQTAFQSGKITGIVDRYQNPEPDKLEKVTPQKTDERQINDDHELDLIKYGVKIKYSPQYLQQNEPTFHVYPDNGRYQIGMRYFTPEGQEQNVILATMPVIKEDSEDNKIADGEVIIGVAERLTDSVKRIEDVVKKTITYSGVKSLEISETIDSLEKMNYKITDEGKHIISLPKGEKVEIMRTEFTDEEKETINKSAGVNVREAILLAEMKNYIVSRCDTSREELLFKMRNNREVQYLDDMDKKEIEEYIIGQRYFNDLSGYNIKKLEKIGISQKDSPNKESKKYFESITQYVKKRENGEKNADTENGFGYYFSNVKPVSINVIPKAAIGFVNSGMENYLHAIPENYRDENYKKYETYLQIREEFNEVLLYPSKKYSSSEKYENSEEYKTKLEKYNLRLKNFIQVADNPLQLEKVCKEREAKSEVQSEEKDR